MINFQERFRVIPSVTKIKDLESCLSICDEYVLLSDVHIGNLEMLVKRCHKENKKVIVNMDLIDGFSTDKVGINLLKNLYNLDVIISSNTAKLNMAKNVGLYTIQRVILMDSKSLETALKSLVNSKCDAIEIIPSMYGIKYYKYFKKVKDVPLLIGGFIDKEDIIVKAKQYGFSGVTTSTKDLWNIKQNS